MDFRRAEEINGEVHVLQHQGNAVFSGQGRGSSLLTSQQVVQVIECMLRYW